MDKTKSQNIIKGKYRPEIDGLRAFAIISVIINHFNSDILPSGYLGVDIFFCISGYVITSSLATRTNKNFWEFINGFYERRIKRLVPALVAFVLIMSILICLFNHNPRFALRTGISSLFGLSNLYLLKQSTDYFAQSTELNVFTNTWSLGVEEQFYLLFPLLIWFTGFGRQGNKGAKNLFTALLFLVSFSLISFVYLYSANQPAAYFLMPTRFWEIATGSIVFLFSQKRKVVPEQFGNHSPIVILLAMGGVMFLPISAGVPSTILIVFLSAFLIFCLKEGTSLFNLFTNKNIVYIGLISYSLYLWHWGVLSLSRSTIGIHWWSIPFQIGLIYLLAVVSYKWIENPLRGKDWSIKRSKTILKGLFTLILTATSLFIIEKPLKGKLYLGDSKLVLKEPYFKTFLIDKNCYKMSFKKGYDHKKVLNNCLVKNEGSKRTLFFLGDSHTRQLWLGSEYIAKKTNSNLLTFSYGATLFPSIKTYGKDTFQYDFKYNQIVKSFEKEILSNFKKGDIIFIKIRFPLHFGLNLEENDEAFIKNSKREYFEEWLNSLKKITEVLSKKGVKVIISTPTPEFLQAKDKRCRNYNPQWFNKYSSVDCSFNIALDFFTSEDGKYSHIIRRLKEVSSEHKNLYLFDSLTLMCPNSKCVFSLDGKLLYQDDDHISNYAARYILAPQILNFLEEKKMLTNK